MRRVLILLAFLCCMMAHAQNNCKSHIKEVAGSYNFWFYNPEKEENVNARHPLLVFLHGASLCGTNLEKVKRYGPMEALQRGRVIDSYILAPQNPGGSWNPEKIMKLIEWAEQNYSVDSDRIYVYGMSLGGYGTLDMCATYPDRIAAGMAMCGGATVKDLSGLSKLPMWIIHGTADKDVPVSVSDRLVAAIKAAEDDSRLIYTRMKGVDHGRPARVFYLRETYDWLFSHSLKDKGRPVNRNIKITTETLHNAYKDLGRNAQTSVYK